jgi:hypothetical protein
MQARESANRGTSNRGQRGTTIVAPVADDPTDLRANRVAEQPERLNETVLDGGSRGGVSILKKAESGDLEEEQSTARRSLRTSRPNTSAPSGLSPVPSPTPMVQPSRVTLTQTPAAAAALLVSHGRALRVETEGPKTLKGGMESTYRIHVHIDGDVEANDIFVRAGVPSSAKVVAEGSATESQATTETPNEQRFVWTVARLAPRASTTFTMRITPTDGTR